MAKNNKIILDRKLTDQRCTTIIRVRRSRSSQSSQPDSVFKFNKIAFLQLSHKERLCVGGREVGRVRSTVQQSCTLLSSQQSLYTRVQYTELYQAATAVVLNFNFLYL